MIDRKPIISTKDSIIKDEMKWFVGRMLDYIDITMDSASNDRYSKKERLKKMFETEIYGTRDLMFNMSSEKVIQKINEIFELMSSELNRLINLALVDKTQREEFITCIAEKSDETKEKIKNSLGENGAK